MLQWSTEGVLRLAWAVPPPLQTQAGVESHMPLRHVRHSGLPDVVWETAAQRQGLHWDSMQGSGACQALQLQRVKPEWTGEPARVLGRTVMAALPPLQPLPLLHSLLWPLSAVAEVVAECLLIR